MTDDDTSSSRQHKPTHGKPVKKPAKPPAHPPAASPTDLTGTWTFGQEQVLDDPPDPGAASDVVLHGTYTRLRFFVVRTTPLNGVQNAALDVIDDAGLFTRFIWDPTGQAWVAPAVGAQEQFTTHAGVYLINGAKVTLEASSVAVYPTLQLAQYDASNVPPGANKGDGYIARMGDGTSPVTMVEQTITFEPVNKRFLWTTSADPQGLEFSPVYQQVRAVGAGGKNFGDVFVGAISFPQMAFPFYGFDPVKIDLYSDSVPYATQPGTPTINDYRTNPNQSFNGTLIFAFPTADSIDYVRGVDVQFAPFLPMGLTGLTAFVQTEQSDTQTIDTAADHVQSWSTTLGFSGGLGKMLSVGVDGTYKSKVETQQENESRYTMSRKVTKVWVVGIDMPSLEFHPDFLAAIQTTATNMLAGKDPEWERFVDNWGTHYAHAMTQGSIETSETRFSLEAESTLASGGYDLKTTAGGVLDGVSLKTTAGLSQEWSDKYKTTVSTDDISYLGIGDASTPMGIFFDLRPMTELFCPVLIPYRPGDDWGKFAPYVWHDVRDSFESYLERMGLNQPLDPALDTDYSPRVLTVQYLGIQVAVDDRRWGGSNDGELYLIGSLSFQKTAAGQDQQFSSLEKGVQLNKEYRVDGSGFTSNERDADYIVTRRTGAAPTVQLAYDLYAVPGNESWEGPDDALAHFQGSQTLTITDTSPGFHTVTMPGVQVQETMGLDIYYTLNVTLLYEDMTIDDWLAAHQAQQPKTAHPAPH